MTAFLLWACRFAWLAARSRATSLPHLDRSWKGTPRTSPARRIKKFCSTRSRSLSSTSMIFWKRAYRLRVLPVNPPSGRRRTERGIARGCGRGSFDQINRTNLGSWRCGRMAHPTPAPFLNLKAYNGTVQHNSCRQGILIPTHRWYNPTEKNNSRDLASAF